MQFVNTNFLRQENTLKSGLYYEGNADLID